MDLFEAYPHLKEESDPVLRGRALRLIGLSAIVYDAESFYFELSAQSFWTRHAQGGISVGVGGMQSRLEAKQTPVDILMGHLRSEWKCTPRFSPPGQTYVLEGEKLVTVGGLGLQALSAPFFMILTAPRLGGGPEVPDALAQAVYLTPTERRPRLGRNASGMLAVKRASLGEFFGQDEWFWPELKAQNWARLEAAQPLPEEAHFKPVLALRGLRQLWQAGLFVLNGAEAE